MNTPSENENKPLLKDFSVKMESYIKGDTESLIEALKTIPRGDDKHEIVAYSESKLMSWARLIESLENHNIKHSIYYADKIKIMINYK